MIIITPRMAIFQYPEILAMDIAFSRTTIKAEPTKVPAIEPDPPNKLTPPMIQAAITLSSNPVPIVGCAEEKRDVKKIPAMKVSRPIST